MSTGLTSRFVLSLAIDLDDANTLYAGTCGLLVLLAYGLGHVLRPFLPFTIFQDTVISLAGIALMVLLVAHILGSFLSSPFSPVARPMADVDEEDEEEEEDYDEEDEYEEPAYANTHPESRCPCVRQRPQVQKLPRSSAQGLVGATQGKLRCGLC